MNQPGWKVIWHTETSKGLGSMSIFFYETQKEAEAKYEIAQSRCITCSMSPHIAGDEYILGYAHDMVTLRPK